MFFRHRRTVTPGPGQRTSWRARVGLSLLRIALAGESGLFSFVGGCRAGFKFPAHDAINIPQPRLRPVWAAGLCPQSSGGCEFGCILQKQVGHRVRCWIVTAPCAAPQSPQPPSQENLGINYCHCQKKMLRIQGLARLALAKQAPRVVPGVFRAFAVNPEDKKQEQQVRRCSSDIFPPKAFLVLFHVFKVIATTEKILEAVGKGDWATYSDLCDKNLTCFEPGMHHFCAHRSFTLEQPNTDILSVFTIFVRNCWVRRERNGISQVLL